MPVLFKILLPTLLLLLNIKKMFPLIMIVVIYAISFIFVSIPLIQNKNKSNEDENFKGYTYLTTHFLAYCLTFGIWQLIWVYRVTKYLNEKNWR